MSDYQQNKWCLLAIIMGLFLSACNHNAVPQATAVVPANAKAFAETFYTTLNTPMGITLKGAGSGTLQFSVTTQPANGILSGQLVGTAPTITYTPKLNYFGTDAFNFTVIDVNGSLANGAITIVVQKVKSPLTDTDGDGLTDLDELNIWKTNPNMVDTDGDSLSDFKEVIDLAFNPSVSNLRFNPLIADLPKLGIKIDSVPSFSLNYTTTAGSASTISTSNTIGSSTTTSTSTTDSSSHQDSSHWTVGGEVGAEGFKATGEYGETKTDETSHSFTRSQATENSTASENGKSFEQSNSIAKSSGNVAVAVRVINNGSLPFTLKNFQLSAIEVNSHGSIGNALGGMNLDGSAVGRFPAFTLTPGQQSGPLIFRSTDYDPGTAHRLMDSAKGLRFRVALSETVDASGTPFAFNQTDLSSKDAAIIIDYADQSPTERYQISVVGDPAALHTTAATALSNILKIPYVVDANNLLSIRNIAADPTKVKSVWLAVLINNNVISRAVTVYDNTGVNPNPAGTVTYKRMNLVALQAMQLHPGDVLRLELMEDLDGDGLEIRQEKFLGTDPQLADTDADGLNDKAELDGWNISVTDQGEMSQNTLGFGKVIAWPMASARATGHSVTFAGDLDEVSMWSGVRSAAQVNSDALAAIGGNALVPTINTIAYWPMDSVNGTLKTSPDATGHGNSIKIANMANNPGGPNNLPGTVLATTPAPLPVPLPTNGVNVGLGYFHLDGSDDQLMIPDRLISGQRSMTIEMRFRALSGSDGVMLAYRNSAGKNYVPALYIGKDGRLRGEFWQGSSKNIMISRIAVNDGNWHHVALVYDEANQIQWLYLDGVIAGMNPASLPGLVDHLGKTTTYAQSSDPLNQDMDLDGLNDAIEFTNKTDPTLIDTDGDFLLDNVDVNPTIKESVDVVASNIVASVAGLGGGLATTSLTINTTAPSNLGALGVTDYGVVILKQEVLAPNGALQALQSLPATNSSVTIGSILQCKDNTPCWSVIYSDANLPPASNIKGTLVSPIVETDIRPSPTPSIYHYMMLVRVDGYWFRSKHMFQFANAAQDIITITMLSVQNGICNDNDLIGGFFFAPSRHQCERRWDAGVLPDGQNIAAGDRSASSNATIVGTGMRAPRIFYRSRLPGSCITIATKLTEGGNGYSRNSETHKICYDTGWGSVFLGPVASNSNPFPESNLASSLITNVGSEGTAGWEGEYQYSTARMPLLGDWVRYNANHLSEFVDAKANYSIKVQKLP